MQIKVDPDQRANLCSGNTLFWQLISFRGTDKVAHFLNYSTKPCSVTIHLNRIFETIE